MMKNNHHYSPLLCPWLTGCSRFIIGFFRAGIPWYVGAFVLLCARYDHREKPGYVACTVVVSRLLSQSRLENKKNKRKIADDGSEKAAARGQKKPRAQASKSSEVILQIMAYLLISAASYAVPLTNKMREGPDNVSTDISSSAISMAFLAFFPLACAFGYKLCTYSYVISVGMICL
ncbi:hypothetical protein POM88_018946 [Heracleum sosnowskyi]|uniref:Uncharacterized protein n=1 Tax=Heracleum sosnowskyi TaxID=360622 RepID=A0AAD8N0V7_9APIA|nr:hypothetical protein POM88_018946 [Heracleum sosnowskyi]